MKVDHPEIKAKLDLWQRELQELTGNEALIIIAYHPSILKVHMQDIEKIVCEETGLDRKMLRRKTRFREEVMARQLVSYYSALFSHVSLKNIAKHMGFADHSTVIHHRDRVRELLDVGDAVICSAVAKINKRLEERNNQT